LGTLNSKNSRKKRRGKRAAHREKRWREIKIKKESEQTEKQPWAIGFRQTSLGLRTGKERTCRIAPGELRSLTQWVDLRCEDITAENCSGCGVQKGRRVDDRPLNFRVPAIPWGESV